MVMWKLSELQVILGAGTVIALGIIAIKTFKSKKSAKDVHKVMPHFDKISQLKNPSVHMKNPQKVEDFLHQFKKDGKSNLMVIADFDFTMSRFHENGNNCQSCHGALESSSLIPPTIHEQSQLLYNTYHPIELDHHIDVKEKAKHMEDWWKKSADLIVSCNLNKDNITQIMKESKVRLRSGCDLMIETLNQQAVPLFVISAGLGDLIVEALQQQATKTNNMKIIANFMKFDTDGSLVAFMNETIHCCNKNKVPLYYSGFFNHVGDHKNIILIGDLIEDSSMADCIPNCESVLKIGYLNNNFEKFLPKFKDTFDIVLVDDQSFDAVNGILQFIL